MKNRGDAGMAFRRGILVLASLIAAGSVAAQNPPVVQDTSGGVTPAAIYKPNIGGAFTSRWAAEASLRSAAPDNLGRFLYERNTQDLSSTKRRIYFAVKRQPPAQYHPYSYQFLELVDAPPLLPEFRDGLRRMPR